MFSEEYTLIKPPYSLLIARKYSGNYRAQLVIPIEVRNKLVNNIRYQHQFPIITLPLMTTYATFIINGCERVMVSQIIRSPGIYFEKNKTQKVQKHFKRKLSTDINKLRAFLPSGEAFISESDLFFSIPKRIYDDKKDEWKTIPNWINNDIYYYSIQHLKQVNKMSIFYFLQCFKLYKLISKNFKSKAKIKLIQIFIKWLKLKNQSLSLTPQLDEKKIQYILHYFQFLLYSLTKYRVLKRLFKEQSQINFLKNTNKQVLSDNYNLSKNQLNQLLEIYNKTIINSQTLVQLQLNYQLILRQQKVVLK